MSYILDALKKSEQERGHGAVPGVQTTHSSSLNYHQDKPAVWPWFLVAAITINIVVLVYFMQSRTTVEGLTDELRNPVETAPSINGLQQQSTYPETAPVVESMPMTTKSIVVIEKPVANQAYANAEPTHKVAELYAPEVTDFHDLPFNTRQYIPAMDFSAHVYSSNPQQRSLVINNRFMEEGEQITNELTLVEITSDGAIFDFRGTRFRTSVLSGWK